MEYTSFFILLIISYVVGNISPASIIARVHGIDIRGEGSGNPGTTNVLRILGVKAALLTFLVDMGKGFLMVKVGGIFLSPELAGFCGLAAFLGHVFPVTMKFKGGKGVATAIGAVFAVNFFLGLILIGIFLLIVIISRMVSLGSILATAAFVPFSYLMGKPMFVPGCIMVVTIILKHRKNIGRIVKGQESRLGDKKKEKR